MLKVCLNCTVMELKLVNFNRRNDNNRSLNCTVMELKQLTLVTS